MRGRSCRAFRVFGGLWGLWCVCGLCGLCGRSGLCDLCVLCVLCWPLGSFGVLVVFGVSWGVLGLGSGAFAVFVVFGCLMEPLWSLGPFGPLWSSVPLGPFHVLWAFGCPRTPLEPWRSDALTPCSPGALHGARLSPGKPHTNGVQRQCRLNFFAFILALATANVAALARATLVGLKDVDAAYPGARLDCPLSPVSFVP